VPSLKDIRRRIGSVQKTQQITRAMRMVAGAKLRRAQDAIESARPYAERMQATLAEVAASQGEAEHPLLVARGPVKRVEIVVATSDRGLCGAFNANAVKYAEALVLERERAGVQVAITCSGRKGADFFRRRRAGQIAARYDHPGWVTYGQAVELAQRVSQRYADGEVDEVILVFNEFVSAMTQRPQGQRLLPFAPPGEGAGDALPYEIEPDAPRLLAVLVPKAIEVQIFRALLENQAGEHAARMTAMEAATRNTEELIDSLTLQFNRARQAAITKELVEIVSGAEAL
jgi:F-type H+-transporting ATPase subunit gamma